MKDIENLSVIPCEQNEDLRCKIEEFAEALRITAHTLGSHGLSESEFYHSGLFRGTIERLRGQFSATMRDKREFVQHVLNYLQDKGFIAEWESAGEANRHDYSIQMKNGCTTIIELKGCLDGNNTNIFERPPQADEFIIWSVCTNPGADPRKNAWSGIHTRLSAEIISREERVDGVIIWDMVCATIGRPCPKIGSTLDRLTEVGPFKLPPACIYLFPSSIPHPRNNPKPMAQPLEKVHFLHAIHQCFHGDDKELNFVDFEVEYQGVNIVRRTRIRRADQIRESGSTAIRRT